MTPGGRRGAATATLWLLALTAYAEPPSVPRAEAERAEQITSSAEAAGDAKSPEANLGRARAMLRAYRWDPTRRDGLIEAIGLLEPLDPLAALRQTGVLLAGGEPLPAGAAKTLRRVRARVEGAASFESWRLAGRVSQRLAEDATAGQPGWRGAPLWLEAGLAYATAGDYRDASTALERYQIAIGDAPPSASVPWARAVEAHLAAGEPMRAAGALDRLVAKDPTAPEAPLLRARLALLVGEPLAAVDHAREAYAAAPLAEQERRLEAGRVLIEALSAANQPEIAIEGFPIKNGDAAESSVAALLRAEALSAAGEVAAAAEACQKQLAKRLGGLPEVDPTLGAGGGPDDPPEDAEALAELARMRLRLGVRRGDPLPALGLLPLLASRLGNIDALAEALAEAAADEAFVRSAREWVTGYARRATEIDLPPGARRAALRVALAVSATEEAATLASARFSRLIEAGGSPVELAREAEFAAIDLLDAGDPAAAERVVREALARLAPIFAENKLAEGSLSALRVTLAETIAITIKSDDALRRDEAQRLIERAVEQAPRDAAVLDAALRALAVRGDAGLTLRFVERRLVLTPSPDGPAGDEGRREALRLKARTLFRRNNPGDRAEAAESLERVLDGWPDDAEGLAILAEWLAEESPISARAERMSRRALELAPTSPRVLAARGWVMLQAGRADEAAALLDAAVDRVGASDGLQPVERELIRRRRAAALRAQGRAEEAAAESLPGA